LLFLGHDSADDGKAAAASAERVEDDVPDVDELSRLDEHAILVRQHEGLDVARADGTSSSPSEDISADEPGEEPEARCASSHERRDLDQELTLSECADHTDEGSAHEDALDNESPLEPRDEVGCNVGVIFEVGKSSSL